MDTDPIDLKYAKEVADYLGSEHTEVIMSKDEVLDALEKVIWHLETWILPLFVPASECTWSAIYSRKHRFKVLLTVK